VYVCVCARVRVHLAAEYSAASEFLAGSRNSTEMIGNRRKVLIYIKN
jgi:hypothetical protein